MDVVDRRRRQGLDEVARLVEATARGEGAEEALAAAGIERSEAANRILQALGHRPVSQLGWRRHPRRRR